MKALILVFSLLPLMSAQEPGVYSKADGKLAPLTPEAVKWKAGGELKHIATAGLAKRDLNARVDGAHSTNPAGPKTEIVVVVPAGAEITRYQLVHMRAAADARKFRATGAAVREALDFSVRRDGPRGYALSLDSLEDGEYGLLPPGAEPGKIYSFRIVNSGVQITRRSSHGDLLHDLAWPGHGGDIKGGGSGILHDLAWPGH